MRHLLQTFVGLCCVPSAFALEILDRSNAPFPLVIDRDTDLSDVMLVDLNQNRPAIVLMGAKLEIGGVYRRPDGNQDRDTDPGLGKTFDGLFLPRLQISFSHHDFARAAVAAMGTFHFTCPTMVADTCLSVTAMPDGTYGSGSLIKVTSMSGYRFGVLATGQKDLNIDIGKGTAALWQASNTGPGHTVYFNESRFLSTNEFLRVKGATVRIGCSRGVVMAPKVSADHVTAKFKGSWDVDYVCLDDQNPCGALDQYGASGTARVLWACPPTDAKNPVFSAFRLGGDGGFGAPSGKFLVSGSFDATKADQRIPFCRVETPWSAFGVCKVTAGGEGSFYPGTDQRGLSQQQAVID